MVDKLVKQLLDEIQDYVCKVGMIFIGGCGCNDARRLIHKMSPEDFPDLYLFATDTNVRVLRLNFPVRNPQVQKWLRSGRLTIHLLGKDVTHGRGAGTEAAVGKAAAETEKSQKALTGFIQPLNKVVLVYGVGKGTGSGAGPAAAYLAKKKLKKSVTAVVTVPAEKEKRGEDPKVALKKTKDLVNTFAIRNEYLDEYLKELPKEERELLTKKDGHELVSSYSTVRILSILQGILQETGDEGDLDENDYDKIQSMGHDMFMGRADIPMVQIGPEWVPDLEKLNAEAIAKKLIKASFQDPSILTRGKVLGTQFDGPWPITIADEIRDRVLEHMAGGRDKFKTSDVKVIPGFKHEVSDNIMSVAILVAAPHKLSAEEGNAQEEEQVEDGRPLIRFRCMGDWREERVATDLANRYNLVISRIGSTAAEQQELEMVFKEVEEATGNRPDTPDWFKKQQDSRRRAW